MPPSIFDLPKEILLYIFQLSLERENKVKCLLNICDVYPEWKYLYLDSSLWKKFDGTWISFERMMKMCKAGSFRMTKEFIISPVETPSDICNNNIAKLFRELKNVNILDFSNLKITKNILSAVADNCFDLREIRFGLANKGFEKRTVNSCVLSTFLKVRGSSLVSISLSQSKGFEKKTVNSCVLSPFLRVRGSSLVSISLSQSKLIGPSIIIRCIADCCLNLEQLYMLCTSGAEFPTEYVQMKCPKLKVLHLDGKIILSTKEYSEGFPQLEDFLYYDNEMYCILQDWQLNCILFNSPKLKSLNLTHCRYISADSLNELPSSALQCLNISKTFSSQDLSLILSKWCNSLTEVDVSFATHPIFNVSIAHLISSPSHSPLKSLNLSYSNIEPGTVLQVLQKCPHLQVLGLASCRSLYRVIKKNYNGKLELQELEKNIKSVMN